jgi:AraC-like DNA-binding protein
MQRRHRPFLFFCLSTAAFCIALATHCGAAVTQFRNLNVSDGLLNNQVWRVVPLDNRSILVGHDNVFTIYDGSTFRDCRYDFRYSYRLSSYAIGRTYIDSQRRIWIKNYVNLFLFDQHRNAFVYNIDSIFRSCGVRDHVNDFFMDDDGTTWLLTCRDQLYATKLNGSSRCIYTLNGAEKKKGLKIIHMTRWNDEYLLFFSDGQIKFWDSSTHRIVYVEQRFHSYNYPYAEITSLKWDAQTLIVGIGFTNGGLFRLNMPQRTWQTLETKERRFIKLLRDGEGNLYSFTISDMHIFNRRLQMVNAVNVFSAATKSFVTHDILDACMDWQHGLWIASYMYGLFYTHSSLDVTERIILPSDKSPIIGISDMADGTHLLCCTENGAYSIDHYSSVCRNIYTKQGVKILSLSKGQGTEMLLSTTDGLIVIEGTRVKEIYAAPGIGTVRDGRNFFAINVDGRLFTCFGSEQIGWIDRTTKRFVPVSVPKSIDAKYHNFNFGYYDRNHGRIVIGAKFGVLQYDLKSGHIGDFFHGQQGFEGYSVSCNDYVCDRQGYSWFATNAGVFVFTPDGKRRIRLTVNNGLPNNCIKALHISTSGIVWVLTTNGLASVKFNPKHFDPTTFIVNKFEIGNLIEGGEFVNHSVTTAFDQIWCGSTNGLVRLNPKSLTSSTSYSYQPLLSSFSIYDHELPSDGRFLDRKVIDTQQHRINLRYDENFFALTFSACNYLKPTQTRYRYKLDGMNGQWIQVISAKSDLKIPYTGIAPGKHTLHIQVCNERGDWGPEVQWSIIISPPWWATWWAYTLYLLLAVAFGIGCYYAYRERYTLLEQLREKRNHFLVQAAKVKPEDIQITASDELFLRKAVADVESHISDPQYGVEMLSRNMALTRSALYRKIQAISGQTPTEFIRSIRLRRAEQFLRESGLTVDEIAVKVGFSSSRYFSGYFKKMYGETPTSYRHGIH